MWKYVEYSVMPTEIDTTSSSYYVYVRKDIVEVQKEEMDGNTTIVYGCMEQEISKDDWELYVKMLNHDVELTEIQDALIELATIVTEV